MPLIKLSHDEMSQFLNRVPALVGVVGSIRPDGYPHLVPVWYRWDGAKINIWTTDERRWVRNIVENPKVAFAVSEDEVTNTGVSLRGTAEVITSDDPWIHDEARRISRRYIPHEAEMLAYVNRWLELRSMVVITPEKTNAWREVA